MNHITGIIGTGRMGGALAGGLVADGSDPARLRLFDMSDEALERTVVATGASSSASPADLAEESDVVVIAVKPQNIDSLLDDISGRVKGLAISIAAGVTTQRIEHALGEGVRVVRVMPNTPFQIGMGASAYALGSSADEDDGAIVRDMFGRFGTVVQVEEDMMDVVTGLSGSGPAFVYYMLEAMVHGAVDKGMDRQTALNLAAQTALGAASMIMETGRGPAELREEVTSPGGTTLAGLSALDERDWFDITASAVIKAAERSAELGRTAGTK